MGFFKRKKFVCEIDYFEELESYINENFTGLELKFGIVNSLESLFIYKGNQIVMSVPLVDVPTCKKEYLEYLEIIEEIKINILEKINI